jgi:hypothetical protein
VLVSREELDEKRESVEQGAGEGLSVRVAGNGCGEARAPEWRFDGARLRRAGRVGGALAIDGIARERERTREGERARVKEEGESSVDFYRDGEGEGEGAAPRGEGGERPVASKPLMADVTTIE